MTNKFLIKILVLSLVLIMPGGLALADSFDQIATPTVSIETTPVPVTPSPLDIFQIPGIMQTEMPPTIPDITEVVTFENFRFEELTLRGPFSANAYYFDLPPTWRLKDGAELRLVLDTFYSDPSSNTQGFDNSVYGGTLLIQYNFVTVAAVDLNEGGQRQIIVPIPLETLNRLGSNQGHSIQFILDSGINCDVGFRTTIVVRTNSNLFLPHDVIDPPVDLRLLPAPFYISSFNRYASILVVPDNPTVGELQSALSVAAGFGRMTFTRLDVSLLPISQITPDLLASANLIFVGKPDGLPLLQQISLPAPIIDGNFAAKDSAPTDGIVQIAISPWNSSKVVLVVGGNEDAAVVNAARALSTGWLQVGKDPALSLISGVRPISTQIDTTDINQTFDDLGYDSLVARQVGLNSLNYTFSVPQNYTLGPDAYLDLFFSHTSLLESERSNIVVKLNEEPIGSVRLNDQTAGQGQTKILLPASAVRPGSNRLRLEIYMEARNECVNPLVDGLWMRIDSSSMLHLPLIENSAATSILLDLSRYPVAFAFDPVMGDLAFVLAPNDPVGWNIASKIALSLGNTSAIQLAGLEAYYADSVPDIVRQQRSLIVVGRPSNLEIISELYGVLPAPFGPGTDLAEETNLQVSYRLAPGVDIGYLELLSSPWNSRQSILYIGGSSDLGLKWAGAALQIGRLRSQLSGNLAFISGEQIVTADTRFIRGVQGVMSTAIPFALTPNPSEPQVVIEERPGWILPALYVAVGGILLVLVILGVQTFMRERPGK